MVLKPNVSQILPTLKDARLCKDLALVEVSCTLGITVLFLPPCGRIAAASYVYMHLVALDMHLLLIRLLYFIHIHRCALERVHGASVHNEGHPVCTQGAPSLSGRGLDFEDFIEKVYLFL